METKDNSKAYLIIIAVLLFIIGIGVGYYVGTNKIEKNDVKEEQKEPKKEEQLKPEEIVPEKEIKKGTLNSDLNIGEKDSKIIKINDKEIELTYEIEEDEGPGIRYLKVNDIEIGKWSPNGINSIEYEVVTGSDDKEYLVVMYKQWYDYLNVIDEEGNLILEYSTIVEKESCGISSDEIDDLIFIRNNMVYFYQYKGNSANNKEKIEIELVKLDINKNKAIINKTGETKEATLAQCY